jgi:hypothetical protein
LGARRLKKGSRKGQGDAEGSNAMPSPNAESGYLYYHNSCIERIT